MKTLLFVLLGLAVVLLTGWLLTRRPAGPPLHAALTPSPGRHSAPILHRTPGPGVRQVRPGPGARL